MSPALRPRIGTLAGLREDSRYSREYGGAESVAREGQALALRGPGGYSRGHGGAGGSAREGQALALRGRGDILAGIVLQEA